MENEAEIERLRESERCTLKEREARLEGKSRKGEIEIDIQVGREREREREREERERERERENQSHGDKDAVGERETKSYQRHKRDRNYM